MDILSLIGRNQNLFDLDLTENVKEINTLLKNCKVLVIGGAGTIGSAVTLEIFKRNPKSLHVVDISENNLVELVRNIRSSIGYSGGDFKTFAVDSGSCHFEALVKSKGPYDYVFNLSALKHVRSEKDPFTLMRLIEVNIFNTLNSLKITSTQKVKNYFCVSTDKAANPVNMMGAQTNNGNVFNA